MQITQLTQHRVVTHDVGGLHGSKTSFGMIVLLAGKEEYVPISEETFQTLSSLLCVSDAYDIPKERAALQRELSLLGIQNVRKEEEEVERSPVTGNPVGTDTVPANTLPPTPPAFEVIPDAPLLEIIEEEEDNASSEQLRSRLAGLPAPGTRKVSTDGDEDGVGVVS